MDINFTTGNTMRIIFLFFTSVIFAQATKVEYTNPTSATVPFFKNDKAELRTVINNNSDILKQLDDAIDLLNGGGIRTLQKTINANTTVDFFYLQNTNGVLSVDAKVISEGTNFFLIKNYDITFIKGQQGIFINQSTNNPAHDFEIVLTNITDGANIIGYKFSVQNLSTTLSTTITITLTIGGSSSPITFFKL